MKYMGSKSKIAKYIIPIIHQRMQDYNLRTYVEPFAGGCNVIDKIKCEKRIACDKNEYLIALYQNLDKLQTLPDFITHDHYSDVRTSYNKKDNRFPKWYIGAVGFLASYNGRFFDGGYAGLVKTKSGLERNYYEEAKKNLEKQIPDLKGIEYRCGDYRKTCGNLEDALIYCDPPYKGTKQYGISRDFNYAEFWDWCREMSERNVVIISEQEARDDFDCIWEHPVKRTINNGKTINATEKLFEFNEWS